jgi:hypothetical protein
MMSGYMDGAPSGRRRSRAYAVVARNDGWCVAVNGCSTRSLPDRAAAERIARDLQHQADVLCGRGTPQ